MVTKRQLLRSTIAFTIGMALLQLWVFNVQVVSYAAIGNEPWLPSMNAVTRHENKLLLNLPFYVYEELIWETATWDGIPVDEWIEHQAQNPKHMDDYWFRKAALNHPMRTKDPKEAKLFVIPTLNNLYDSKAFFKTKDLCWKGRCNTELMKYAGEFLLSTPTFRAHPEHHLAVVSHFAHFKSWWTNRLDPAVRSVLETSHVIGFEDRRTNQPELLHLPKLHVGKPCKTPAGDSDRIKTADVALVATLKPKDKRFRDRETLCQWLASNHSTTTASSKYVVDVCGQGDMCPALAQAKFGFHVRGDTLSSNRLFDTLLSETVPIFTLSKQYQVVPDFIDWRKISHLIDLKETTTRESFDQQLQKLLHDTQGYQEKLDLIRRYKHLLDWKTGHPFDLYMYRLQLHLYPNHPKTLEQQASLQNHPFLRFDQLSSPSSNKNMVRSLSEDLCPNSRRCRPIDISTAKLSYVHISKNAGVSWIRELKKLKQIPKNLPGSVKAMRDNFYKAGLYPIADSGAEHGLAFQDDLLKDHRPFLRLLTLRSPRHQIWSMFSHCYYSKWGRKATKQFFPRDHPENDLLDLDAWLDHFLNDDGTAVRPTPHDPTFGCYHPQNYQSRALVSWEETPRHPKAEGMEPNATMVEANYHSLDWVGLTAFFHESKCLLYYRIQTQATGDEKEDEISDMVQRYVDATCRCATGGDATKATGSGTEPLDEKMTHATEGHRDTLLDLPLHTLQKLDLLSQVDLSLYRLALDNFMKEMVWLESALERRVLCDSAISRWESELAYTGTNLTQLYRKAKTAAIAMDTTDGTSKLASFWDLIGSRSESNGIVVKETLNGREEAVELKASNFGKRVDMKTIERDVRQLYEGQGVAPPNFEINHIYYINLEHRHRRRAIMEAWLQDPSLSLSIDYERVSAKKGFPDKCRSHMAGDRCMGVSGLVETNLHIMDNLNVTGLTLILEDDFVIRDMKKLIASINLVPPDWDVLRWDCWQEPLRQFEVKNSAFRTGPVDESKCQSEKQCWFCGGTHATLWREESIEKLRKVWAEPPYRGLDCRLSDPSLKSYCIQVGVGEFHHVLSEFTDIPKI